MRFDDFATSQLRSLLGIATVVSGDASLAEDLVQDVLLKAHANWGRVEAARDPVAYVRRMLVNEHLSWRRKWARIVPAGRAPESREWAPDHAVAHAAREEIMGLLAVLPPRQQVVLALRYYEGLDDAEIADAMHCSPGTVRGYASRALTTLRAAQRINDTRTERITP